MLFCYRDTEYQKSCGISMNQCMGNLIVHTSVEPTQILAMRMNVDKVMCQPTLELYTSYGI